ncbi:MAG: hypothetical protein ABI646_05055 [Acidobacteriota bacterium]
MSIINFFHVVPTRACVVFFLTILCLTISASPSAGGGEFTGQFDTALAINPRFSSFPTTFLISPEGKILSMSRQERKEPDLRGADLLDSLDEVLSK